LETQDPTPYIAGIDGGVRLRLRIQPRASRTEVAGLHGDAIRIRLAAPPVDGAANEALLKFLADKLSVPRSCVRLTAGKTSRSKVVTVTGIDVQHVTESLNLSQG
jgi:uncharacterized protein